MFVVVLFLGVADWWSVLMGPFEVAGGWVWVCGRGEGLGGELKALFTPAGFLAFFSTVHFF